MPRKAKTGSTNKAKTKAPRGSVGQATFEAVERLVAQGMKKGEAIKRVAETTKRSPGTVSVTYYRVARTNGGGRRRAAGRPRGARKQTPQAGLLNRAGKLLQELGDAIREQEKELLRLRQESAIGAKLRELLKKI